MVSIAGLIFVRSFQYGWNARLFPQVTSMIVLAGGSGLLLRDVIQASPRSAGPGQEASLGEHPDWLDIEQTPADDEPTGDGPPAESTGDEPTVDGAEVGFLLWLTGFVTSGLLVGFLYATPVSVLTYGYWKGLSRTATAGLTLLATLITYLFMLTLNLQLADGYILS